MCCPSNCLWKTLCERVVSKMTMHRPAMIAEMKKKMKMNPEYQSGWSFVGASRKSEPSALWCIVENITERTVSAMSVFFMTPCSFFQPSHSKNGTVNSRKSTVVYIVTHQATSNSAD